jgi:pentatricopeptide repeat protein
VEIDRHDETHYRVILTHMGFGRGGRWDEVVQYFDEVWEYVLSNLRKLFEEKRALRAEC